MTKTPVPATVATTQRGILVSPDMGVISLLCYPLNDKRNENTGFEIDLTKTDLVEEVTRK